MAEKIKGINIEIGGDTTKLSAALSRMNRETKSVQSELRSVERLLKFDPENTELLAQKEKLLGDQIKLTKNNVDALKRAKNAADEEMKSGTAVNEKEYRKLQREIINAENSLRGCENALSDMSKATETAAEKIEEISDASDKAENGTNILSRGFTIAKGAISGFIVDGVQALIGKLKDAVRESAEFRREMGLLNAASERNGYSAEEAAEGFEYLYSILGDQTLSRTALSNAQALNLPQEELLDLLHSAVGAWGAYGDSIPIDGLMESVNETSKVAKVTGVLADALNWANINEDEFNEKLEKCSSEQERQKLITGALKEQYSALAAGYEKNNSALIAQNKTELEAVQTTARLGEAFSGAATMASRLKNTLYNSLVKTILDVKDGVLGLTDAQADNVRSVREMSEEYENAQTARADETNARLGEIDGVMRLCSELETLADENGNVKEANRARVEFILGELKEATGEEYKLVDGAIQKYGDLKNNIIDVINTKKLEILMSQQEQSYSEAVANQAEAAKTRNSAYTEYAKKLAEVRDIQEKIAEIEKKYTSVQNDKQLNPAEKESQMSALLDQGNDLREQLAILEQDAGELKAVYDAASENYSNYVSDIETYEEAMRLASEKGTAAAINFLKTRNQAYLDADAQVSSYEQSTRESIARLGSEYQNALLDLNSSLGLYLETGSSSAKRAVDEALGAVEAKKTDFIAAGGEIRDGLIDAMDNNGKPVTVNLKQLSSGIEEQLKKLETMAEEQGKNLAKGTAEGVDAWNDDNPAYAAAREFAKRILDILPKKADMHSPSKVTREQGENLVRGVAVGISAAEAEAVTSMENVWESLRNVSENAQLTNEKLAEKVRKRELSNLKNALDLEVITEQEYYTRLKRYRDEYCEQGSDDWYNFTLQIVKFNKKMADSAAAEAENAFKTIQNRLSELVGELDDRSALLDSELELWGYENPRASAYDKKEKELGVLTQQISLQERTVQATNDALWEAKQATGENSSESIKLQKQLNNEKIELEKLNAELRETIRLRQQAYTSSLSESAKNWTSETQSSTSGSARKGLGAKLAPLKAGQKWGQETTINITQNYQGYKGTVSENNAALKKTLKNAEVLLS